MGRGTPTDFTHTVNSTARRRSCGFGIGDRFTRRSSSKSIHLSNVLTPFFADSPCPTSYDLGTCFKEDNPVYKAHPATQWCKRASRDAYQSTLTPSKTIGLRGSNPGPGTYSYKNMAVGVDAKKFSFRRRTINHRGKVTFVNLISSCFLHYSNFSLIFLSGAYNEAGGILTILRFEIIVINSDVCVEPEYIMIK